MMSDIARTTLDFLKLAPRYFVAAAVMAGSLLFLPLDWVDRLGLADLVVAQRHWLGLTFLASATLWLVAMGHSTWLWAGRTMTRRRERRRTLARLNGLTEDEKQTLRYYIERDTRSNSLRMEDGVVQGLVGDGVIYRSASIGTVLGGVAHNLTDLAESYIKANPEVLLGSTKICRTDERRMW